MWTAARPRVVAKTKTQDRRQGKSTWLELIWKDHELRIHLKKSHTYSWTACSGCIGLVLPQELQDRTVAFMPNLFSRKELLPVRPLYIYIHIGLPKIGKGTKFLTIKFTYKRTGTQDARSC